MTVLPIGSNPVNPHEPNKSKSPRAIPAPRSETSTRETEAAKARGLVEQIGTRLKELRSEGLVRQDKVDEALEEMRQGKLLSRENLEGAAESMLFGDE
jgi:hypothetical protein